MFCVIRLNLQASTRSSSLCHKLSEAFGRSRALLRDVGVAASVPIEPELQTSLIDATLQVFFLFFLNIFDFSRVLRVSEKVVLVLTYWTLQLPGVLACGVPGAFFYLERGPMMNHACHF